MIHYSPKHLKKISQHLIPPNYFQLKHKRKKALEKYQVIQVQKV